MEKLYYTIGLPGSGKSTLARKMCSEQENLYRINKDTLRLFFDNNFKNGKDFFNESLIKELIKFSLNNVSKLNTFTKEIQSLFISWSGNNETNIDKAIRAKGFSKVKEKLVLEMQTIVLKYLIKNSLDIIIDDTGFNSEHLHRIKSFAVGYDVEIINMHQDPYNVSLEECLKRNSKRSGKAKVPDIAIYTMNKKYSPFCQDKAYITDNNVLICDIDGTLANIDHRIHFLNKNTGEKSDWKSFFDNMDKDIVREEIKSLVYDSYPNHDVILVTGRPDSHKEMTEKWLKDNGIAYKALYMRRSDDRRSDVLVKQEIIDKYLPKNKIKVWIDDRKQVIDQVRSNGINVINVGGLDNDF
jgi:predicted kinase